MENTFTAILYFISDNWFALVALVIACVLAIVLYFKSKKDKKPCYSISSANLIEDLGSKVEGLQMGFSGEPIENLTVCRFAFWNEGRDTIHRDNIADGSPIGVHAKNDLKILGEPKVICPKNLEGRYFINLASDFSHFDMDFEYMDQNEGFIIQFFHNGTTVNDVEVHGKVKGVKKFRNKHVITSNDIFAPLPKFIKEKIGERGIRLYGASISFLFGLLFFLGMGISISIYDHLTISGTSVTVQQFHLVVMIIFPGIVALISLVLGITILGIRIPKGFEIFEEEF